MDRPKILVVDDDESWLETIELILDGQYELRLTMAPTEAISLVKVIALRSSDPRPAHVGRIGNRAA